MESPFGRSCSLEPLWDYSSNHLKPVPKLPLTTNFYTTTHYTEVLPQIDGAYDDSSFSEDETPVSEKPKSKRTARAEKRNADRALRAERRQSKAKVARFEKDLPGLQEQEQESPTCLMSDVIVDEEHGAKELGIEPTTDTNQPTGKFVAVTPKNDKEEETEMPAENDTDTVENSSEVEMLTDGDMVATDQELPSKVK